MRRILISAVLVGLIFFQNSYSLKFVAYGDSRSYATIHEDVVHRFAGDNPELVLHVGDLWDDIGENAWKYAFTSNTVADALLNNNKVLVSRGNHESQSEVLQFTPSILLNDEFLYSFKEGNCFFVSMEYEPQSNNTWLETQLQSTESQSAEWRFIWAHKPIYSSGAGHPSDGSSYLNFRNLCDKYHVTMFFSGHDHHYERSYLIYDGNAVDESTEIEFEDSLNGTIYFVTGGGGAPVYGLQSGKWWGDASVRTTDNHYCLINTDTPGKLEFVAKDKDGSILDQVTITKAVSPYTTLSVPDGGELWEQNSTHTVIWEDNLDEKVKIELYKGGTLNLTISDSTESDGEYEWEIPEDQETGNDYKIKIISVSSDTVFGKSSANFSIEAEYFLNVPYVQNFDALDTGTALPEKWEQLSNEDIDWIVWTGPTPSKVGSTPDVTGPDGDHTSGNGNYLYVDASDPNNPNKKADFITPKFDISSINNLELAFWCHMYSSQNEMGDLYIDVEVDNNWQDSILHLTGDHGDTWFEVTQDLSSYKGDRMRFRFSGITGQSWASDICIDDLRVEGATAISLNNTMSSSPASLKVFGNRIYYNLSDNSSNKNRRVIIKLYNVKGKLIRTLVDGTSSPGTHFVDLNMAANGKTISAGLYLCRLESEGFKKTINVLLRK